MLAKRGYIHVHNLFFRNVIKFNHSTSLSSVSLNPNYSPSKSIIYCNSKISENGRMGNINEAELIFNRMPVKSVVSWTAMLTAYAENGQINKARKVFDEMPQRNVASWNAMISGYMRNKNGIDKACELFSKSPEKNAVSYASMITGFVRAGRLEDAERLYSSMPMEWRDPFCSNALMNGYLKNGKLKEAVRIYNEMVNKNVVSWSSMVDGYCKLGEIKKARELFDEMPDRNVVTWTSMIDGYMKTMYFEDGFSLFLQMRHENCIKLVSNTLTVLFEGCGRYDRYKEGLQLHALVILMAFNLDTFLGNSVITMYSRLGDLNSAVKLFNIMEKKDTVSWNSLIGGYIQAEDIDEAYKHFKTMPQKDVYSWTTMITGLSNKGHTKKSVELFKMMPQKDDISWTALISGFVSNCEYEESIRWFVQMLQTQIKPNPLTFSSVLSSSSSLASLNQGMQIHSLVIKVGMEFDLSVQNSMVSFYAKCGCVNDAYTVFNSINTPNVVSYNSMINGFAQNGYGKEAISLFKEMEKNAGHVSELEPCNATPYVVLSDMYLVLRKKEDEEIVRRMKRSHQNCFTVEPTSVSDVESLEAADSFPSKIAGDQFALMESTIAFAMILQKFDVELKGSSESVELVTGAIIHTKNGLLRKLKNKSRVHEGVEFR
ncbi:hypothetical protein L2E82_02309 [Cichorium intybus]|uniref:Uncharacterized protein n=1 Tax=Cichorium intybus TaxID=13427 RepID=A0ACB9H1A6_CICIN|nr:hypothetical protein L2E82_02309 [Cichorium intybus]